MLRTLHTVRHLRPRQSLFFLLRRRFGQHRVEAWRGGIQRRAGMRPPLPIVSHDGAPLSRFFEFEFLNRVLCFPRGKMDWNPPRASRLWRYNLHYFDFLRDEWRSSAEKSALIDDWITGNPQGHEPAWEPYTTSLRIVNWCLFLASLPAADVPERWQRSLYDQARWLEKNLEWHILANHYFENLKAMLFSAFFFQGRESAGWLRVFQRELVRELKEQFLPDGGHYERTPYYHCILLRDCLELYALHRNNPGLIGAATSAALERTIRSGVEFLQLLRTPDDNIPPFNDSATLPAGEFASLIRQAESLDITCDRHIAGVIDCPHSGYYGYRNAGDYLLVDCGDIGPAYQPGHTHCDFLSYVLMHDHRWLVVDTGVYEYEPGEMRRHVRSTRAHNTVMVDGCEQSEIWGEFRVGRRAEKLSAAIARQGDTLAFTGAYRGFAAIPGGAMHRRTLSATLAPDGSMRRITVVDAVQVRGSRRLSSFIHFHPALRIIVRDGRADIFHRAIMLASVEPTHGEQLDVEDGWYCPAFGRRLENQVLVLHTAGTGAISSGYRIDLVAADV